MIWSRIDPLGGLINHIYLEDIVPNELAVPAGPANPCAVGANQFSHRSADEKNPYGDKKEARAEKNNRAFFMVAFGWPVTVIRETAKRLRDGSYDIRAFGATLCLFGPPLTLLTAYVAANFVYPHMRISGSILDLVAILLIGLAISIILMPIWGTFATFLLDNSRKKRIRFRGLDHTETMVVNGVYRDRTFLEWCGNVLSSVGKLFVAIFCSALSVMRFAASIVRSKWIRYPLALLGIITIALAVTATLFKAPVETISGVLVLVLLIGGWILFSARKESRKLQNTSSVQKTTPEEAPGHAIGTLAEHTV